MDKIKSPPLCLHELSTQLPQSLPSLDGPDLFATLPPELRCMVYDYLLILPEEYLRPRYSQDNPECRRTAVDEIRPRYDQEEVTKNGHVFTAILRTKRLYYTEAVAVLYAGNIFEITVDNSIPFLAWGSLTTASFQIGETLPLMRRLHIDVTDLMFDGFNAVALLKSIADSRIERLTIMIFLRLEIADRGNQDEDAAIRLSKDSKGPFRLLPGAIMGLHAAKKVIVVMSRPWILDDKTQARIRRSFKSLGGHITLAVDPDIEGRTCWMRRMIDPLCLNRYEHDIDRRWNKDLDDAGSESSHGHDVKGSTDGTDE